MDTVLILVYQTLLMLLLAGVGFLLFKGGKISSEGSKSLGNILLCAVLPCVIIRGFLVERTTERMAGLLISLLGAAVILAVCIVISRVVFHHDPVAAFGAAFSNPGFFGIPLITAAIGSDNVFYIAAFIGFLNLLQWTYGVSLMTGKRGAIRLSALLKAPFFIAIIIGLLLFFTELPLPSLLTDGLSAVAGLNTPLAMFTVGVYLAQADIRKMLCNFRLYAVSAVRLIMIPVLCLFLLWPVPSEWMTVKLALFIAAACPVGSNIAVYAHLHGKDSAYAAETVVISTVLSVVTLPSLVGIAQWLWTLPL